MPPLVALDVVCSKNSKMSSGFSYLGLYLTAHWPCLFLASHEAELEWVISTCFSVLWLGSEHPHVVESRYSRVAPWLSYHSKLYPGRCSKKAL